jgi:hypothetical protein
MNEKQRRFPRALTLAAVTLGIAAGSYGIANAANGSSTTPSSSNGTAAATPSAANPWGQQRSDETLLTGDTADKVRALALAKVPGGTIVRVETDADGHAAYEAHMTDASGKPVTVYVDTSFSVVGVESGGPGGPGGHAGAPPTAGASA